MKATGFACRVRICIGSITDRPPLSYTPFEASPSVSHNKPQIILVKGDGGGGSIEVLVR